MIYKFLHDLASTYLFNPISYCSPPRSLHCRHTDLLVIWKNISLFPAQRFYIFCSLYLKYSSSSLHSNLFLIIQASVQISPQRGLPHSTLSPFLHSPSLLSSLYIPLTFFICLHITYQYLKLSFSNLLEVHCLSPSLECKLQEGTIWPTIISPAMGQCLVHNRYSVSICWVNTIEWGMEGVRDDPYLNQGKIKPNWFSSSGIRNQDFSW